MESELYSNRFYNLDYCIGHGLDFGIYKFGSARIKSMIKRKFGTELEIEGKDLWDLGTLYLIQFHIITRNN